MIKPLYFYKKDKHNIIYNIFDDDVDIEFSDIDVDAIIEDFKELTTKLGIADDIYI